jgi:hypothetical protein
LRPSIISRRVPFSAISRSTSDSFFNHHANLM